MKYLTDLKSQIIPILKKHQVTKAGLFGSVLRDDFSDKSDVDVLVELPQEVSYFDVLGLKFELEERTGREIDLVEYSRIKDRLKPYILPEEIRIYEQKN